MAYIDPNEVWLGHVQPVGLVVAPIVLARHGLLAIPQTRADTDIARSLIFAKPDDAGAKKTDPRALRDPWAFFQKILGWRLDQVAGAPGGPALPDDLSLRVEEGDTEIAPHWAVTDPAGGWQILVRIEEPGVRPDERGALAGWEATPHQRLERLLREKEIPTGVLITDDELRFIYAPRGETSGWITFPLRSLCEVGGREMLSGLKLLLSSFRLHNAAPEQRLPALLKASRDAQAEVSTKLASQVLGALHELLRGLHAADRERIEALAASQPDHLYDGLLTVLLRLVFLLYAEDRDLIPSRTDAAARAFYAEGYGVRSLYARLLDDKTHYPDTMEERRGAWPRLLALFRLIHDGDSSGAWIRGRGGKLFDPKAFPFLQGQEEPSGPPSPAPVADGCIQRILDLLVTVDGEKLSYRTLDVEQIGSVYETVMGFTIETRSGPAVAIRAGKNDRTPVFVDIAALAEIRAADRAKFLKKAGRNSLNDKVARTLVAAVNEAEVIDALRPIIDERGSSGGHPAPAGTPLLQPTDERRRTGSHYTPRSLTAPIVQHALEPAFERLGPDARPEDVLELKVCDPAMGSGAFLVEACRALGDRLVKAWERWPETRPTIPADEDEPLHARRLVARCCLFGVDRNPRAVDLAKLSLWLATLARDHEFTFLDHALKCGDSLVGLTTSQIAAANWDETKPRLPLFRQLVRGKVAKAMQGRAEIQNASDDTLRAIQEARHRNLEAEVSPIRTMGDAVISGFFAAEKANAREKARADVESHISGMPPRWDLLEAAAIRLRSGVHGITPFHWQIEFPEVFARDNGGFDAIVGNPPFLGGTKISGAYSASYFHWLSNNVLSNGDKADLIAYFFRRIFGILRHRGVIGIVSTSSIAEGDTRKAALAWVRQNRGQIFRAFKKDAWPGEANVDISRIHVAKGFCVEKCFLEGEPVDEINSFLNAGSVDQAPENLLANANKCFEGFVPYGEGFVVDDSSEGATSTAEIAEIVDREPQSLEVIFPYLGGEDVTDDPGITPSRNVIFVAQMDEDELKKRYPSIYRLLERKVRPFRMSKSERVSKAPWWQFLWSRPKLSKRMRLIDHMIVISRVSKHHAFVQVPSSVVPSTRLSVIALSENSSYAVIQSTIHESWARYFGASRGATANYSPSDCFENFPFPANFETDTALDAAGEVYHAFRARLMIARQEGLTKTYNRFHAREENAADIVRLRALHAAMDEAVLRAYGWNDLAARAVPEFIEEEAKEGKRPKTRFDWPAEFKDEVLARLFALNAERAAAEKAAGITAVVDDDEEEIEGIDA